MRSRARSPRTFQTLRPRAPAAAASPKPRRLDVAEVGSHRPHRVVEPREDGDAIPERRPVLELAAERVAPAAIEINDRRDVRRVQRRDELRRRAAVPAPGERGRAEVVVGVDRGDGRADWCAHVVGTEPRARPVIGQAEVFRRRNLRGVHGRQTSPLSLEPGEGDPAHEVLLGDHEEDDHRQEAYQRPCHHLRPFAHELALEERETHRGRVGG